MVDRFSDLTDVRITRSTSQDEIIEVKVAFERWAAKFGVKINRYNEDNKRFYDQPFRLAIENANKKVKFCGVGYHH